MCVWGGGVSRDDRIVGVKPQEITGKWEINPQNITGEREGASFQNQQATKKSNLASKHTFVALNLVLYSTFSAYMLKFQLLLNCMPQKVGDCTRHEREVISQTIVVMSSDWIGRGKSNYQNNRRRGRTFMSVTCIPFLQKWIYRYRSDFRDLVLTIKFILLLVYCLYCYSLSGTLNSTLVFFVGLICGVTVGGVILIAVIVIIACKIRLDLKLYWCMAIEFTNIKQINR